MNGVTIFKNLNVKDSLWYVDIDSFGSIVRSERAELHGSIFFSFSMVPLLAYFTLPVYKGSSFPISFTRFVAVSLMMADTKAVFF